MHFNSALVLSGDILEKRMLSLGIQKRCKKKKKLFSSSVHNYKEISNRLDYLDFGFLS